MLSKTFNMNNLADLLWEAAKKTDDPKTYSQASLARKLKVSRETTSCWCKNKFQPTKRNKAKVLKYLQQALPELTMEDLFYSKTVSINS